MPAIRIALRYLKAKKSHRAVNIITWTAIIGVAIATMAMVLVLCIFNGFKDIALGQLSSLDPDISIVTTDGKVISNADSIIQVINRDKVSDKIKAAIPTVTDRGLLLFANHHFPVVFKGVPEGYDTISRIDDIMIQGSFTDRANYGLPAIHLSVGVANQVASIPALVSRLEIYVPRRQGRVNPANPAASFRMMDVGFGGVFRAGNTDIDTDNIIIPLDAARDLMDYDSEATAIEITLNDPADEAKTAELLRDIVGPDYKVLDRLQQRQDSFKMISVEKWVTFMMLICVLVITLFNVVSTMSLLAIEKRDNMVTLRALGAPEKMIKKIFITEGFFITAIGGLIGMACGVALALIQQIFHIIKLSADEAVLTINYYPVRLLPSDLVIVAGVVLALAFIISFISLFIAREKKSALR